jgi:hypothetical protein
MTTETSQSQSRHVASTESPAKVRNAIWTPIGAARRNRDSKGSIQLEAAARWPHHASDHREAEGGEGHSGFPARPFGQRRQNQSGSYTSAPFYFSTELRVTIACSAALRIDCQQRCQLAC